MKKNIQAITLRHPWAYMIARCEKRIENRKFRPSALTLAKGDFLAIHGGVPPKGDSLEEAVDDLDRLIGMGLAPAGLTIQEATLPGIVAVVVFGGAVEKSDSPWFHGPFGWLLEDVVVFPDPVPCRGQQGIFVPPPEVLAAVREQYRDGIAMGLQAAAERYDRSLAEAVARG